MGRLFLLRSHKKLGESTIGEGMRDSIANFPEANCMVFTSVCTGESNSPPDCLELDGFESLFQQ